MRKCWHCQEDRPEDEFYAGQSRCKICSNTLRSPRRRKMCFRGCTCDPCETQRQANRDEAGRSPSQSAIYRRATRRGLTVAQVEKMHAERNNRCDVCGEEEHVKGAHGEVKSLAIDHNAETGYVRGLLCSNCNRALGLLGHNPERLQRAIDHLLREWGP